MIFLLPTGGEKIIISPQQFCDMLSPYGSFKFRFEIIDPTEKNINNFINMNFCVV